MRLLARIKGQVGRGQDEWKWIVCMYVVEGGKRNECHAVLDDGAMFVISVVAIRGGSGISGGEC